jgi:tetratricopeptide (TPR) repeat protein
VSSWRCRNIADAYIRATHPNLKLGADWLQRAVEQDPYDLSLRERLGSVLLQTGDFERAAKEYRYLIDKWPDYPAYVLGLAAALRNSGQYDEGAELLLAALQRQPNDPDLRVEYARTLLYQGKYGEAAGQYQQVLRWYPNDIDALIGLGKTYSWAGDQHQALEKYQRVLVNDPDNYDALVAQGFSLIWSARDSEALPILERANSRHPEVAAVRDALKRLHAANIFTGDVSAGGPVWPIQPPSSLARRVSEKGRNTTTEWNPPASRVVTIFPDVPIKVPSASTPSRPNQIRTGNGVLWKLAVGLTALLSVFVLTAFILFAKPAGQQKKVGEIAAARPPESHPEQNLVGQWARLQEFSRSPAEAWEPAPSRRAQISPAAAAASWQSARMIPAESAITASGSGSQQAEPAQRESELWRDPEVAAHRPRRRRRGAAGPPERPWWRDFSGQDVIPSSRQDESELALPSSEDAEPPKPPIFDLPEEVELPAAATPNALPTPSAKPAPPEEPPSRRSFVEVLSRALERANDGQVQEAPEPVQPEAIEEEEPAANAPAPSADAAVPEPAVSQELANASIVIAGSGVMVTHYRSIFKAAGADVRAFTFWDLALSSMRKRRADVLLIDGDALDGLTPARMYDSAQLERYMFGSILVAVSSDEDRTRLPQNVILAHSLTDEDVCRRLLESLRGS